MPGEAAIERWTYDEYGRTETHTDFKGQVTRYVYDDNVSLPVGERTNLGRLVEERRFGSAGSYNEGRGAPQERTHTLYDELGRQSQVTEYVGSGPTLTTTYDYDPVTGQVTRVTNSLAGTVHHEYDPATGRLSRTYTDSNDSSYVYDDFGRLWKVHVTELNGQTVDQWVVYTYDPDGNLATVTQPDGLTTTYTYDLLNRLADEAVTRDDLSTTGVVEATPVMSFHYTPRVDGLRDDVTETRYTPDGTSVFSQTFIDYDYDADGRLTDEAMTVLQGGADAPAPYAYHYTFDLAGNRRQKVVDAGNDGTTDETITYDYNRRDQLLSEDSDTVDAHDATYRYDPNGSQTEKVAGAAGSATTTRYLWDLRNRMVAVDGNGDDLAIDGRGVTSGAVDDASDATYGYDTGGVRVSETKPAGAGGTTTYYLNDDANPTGYAKAVEEKATPNEAATGGRGTGRWATPVHARRGSPGGAGG